MKQLPPTKAGFRPRRRIEISLILNHRKRTSPTLLFPLSHSLTPSLTPLVVIFILVCLLPCGENFFCMHVPSTSSSETNLFDVFATSQRTQRAWWLAEHSPPDSDTNVLHYRRCGARLRRAAPWRTRTTRIEDVSQRRNSRAKICIRPLSIIVSGQPKNT